ILVDARRLQTEQVGHTRLVRRTLGKRRCGYLLPRAAAIARPLQLDAEMAEGLCRVQCAVTRIRQQHGDRIAEKTGAGDRPCAADTTQLEQTFLGADQQPIAHGMVPFVYPPDNAWNTKISSSSPTGSPRRSRSMIASVLI